ncbi:hypothetical protein [Hymenobacter defluvii]|uniref:hypothetical protein n=1 Tax=Hymenobacter defluvii TaxID=2054411 RepID=UPI001AAFA147|nr:hypothetical protein [Hymenobacter defluvii]
MDDTLTLLEQATNAELAYYQQIELFDATPTDLRTWQQDQELYALLGPLEGAVSEQYTPRSYARHVLERHGYSLHRYMARHLSPTAWDYWYARGGILAPFRR